MLHSLFIATVGLFFFIQLTICMSIELLADTALSAIVCFFHMSIKRLSKQSKLQTLSSLTLQEDEWWDLKTIGIGLAFSH